jgi:hypothetical protein
LRKEESHKHEKDATNPEIEDVIGQIDSVADCELAMDVAHDLQRCSQFKEHWLGKE